LDVVAAMVVAAEAVSDYTFLTTAHRFLNLQGYT
jgi:hypothetical protein